MKRLSVIIPGFNNPERWWRRCVESVRSVCGPEDEIICVDDGSSEPVEDKWVGSGIDARVKLIRKKNGGPGPARNAGLEVADGKYIAFVDADDELYGSGLKDCLARIEESGSDVGFYGVITVWTLDGLSKMDIPNDTVYGRLTPENVKTISEQTLFNYVWNKIYSRRFLVANGIHFEAGVNAGESRPQVFGGEDCIFNLRCIMAGAKWCSVSSCGYLYYRPRTTLLSAYQSLASEGMRFVSNVWNEYKSITPNARVVLGDLGEVSASDLLQTEWRNIWMPGTPFSLGGRWKWLKEHAELGSAMVFFKMMLWTFVRRHFYFRPIRRWHIKRLYPHAINCE